MDISSNIDPLDSTQFERRYEDLENIPRKILRRILKGDCFTEKIREGRKEYILDANILLSDITIWCDSKTYEEIEIDIQRLDNLTKEEIDQTIARINKELKSLEEDNKQLNDNRKKLENATEIRKQKQEKRFND